ncbi:MAG: hypothetical protein LC737_09365 [Chloroflexi bacterium]|nr:hypothetical protein [Chloroflexota bacterium]
MRSFTRVLILIVLGILLGSAPSAARAQDVPRKPNLADIKLEKGYRIEPVIVNLSVPTTAVFDGSDLLIAESGWQRTAKPRVIRVKPDGTTTVLARGT